MRKTQLVTTAEKEFDNEISLGVFGLMLVFASIAISYLSFDNTTIALGVGLFIFISTLFFELFRIGYIAILFYIIYASIAAGSFGVILWALIKYNS